MGRSKKTYISTPIRERIRERERDFAIQEIGIDPCNGNCDEFFPNTFLIDTENNQDNCCICFEDFIKMPSSMEIVTLRCSHRYCVPCFQELLKNKTNKRALCPSCRQPIEERFARAEANQRTVEKTPRVDNFVSLIRTIKSSSDLIKEDVPSLMSLSLDHTAVQVSSGVEVCMQSLHRAAV